jgi:hypothetical protein
MSPTKTFQFLTIGGVTRKSSKVFFDLKNANLNKFHTKTSKNGPHDVNKPIK